MSATVSRDCSRGAAVATGRDEARSGLVPLAAATRLSRSASAPGSLLWKSETQRGYATRVTPRTGSIACSNACNVMKAYGTGQVIADVVTTW